LDFGLAKEIELSNLFLIRPQLLLAYDYGYAQGPKDGFSHSAIRSDFAYTINKDITITAVIEKTFAGSILQTETQDADQLWAGMHVVLTW